MVTDYGKPIEMHLKLKYIPLETALLYLALLLILKMIFYFVYVKQKTRFIKLEII